jgi:hypothetical protein
MTDCFRERRSIARISPMRSPSRFMPRPRRRRHTWGVRVARVGASGLLITGVFAALLAHPLIAAAVAAGMALGFVPLARREKRRLAALAVTHGGESIGEFARSYDTRTVDTWVIRAVYEELPDLLRSNHPSFPLRASDRFEDLDIDDEDLEMDVAAVVAERTGRTLDDANKNPFFKELRTVADLVMFFNAQARVEAYALP